MPAEFVVTIGDVSNLPDVLKGEFLKGRRERRIAMVGRSNVGKSSLINALTQAKVAQVSNQPGKTRSIHFYLWKDIARVLADLPGYGFARTSHAERDRWSDFINAYLKGDPALERAVVLLDARHGPTELDAQAIRFLSFEGIPVTFVFTKSDQLKTQKERAARRKEAAAALLALGFDAAHAHWVSSKTKDGLRQLQKELAQSPPGTA